jgi:hypothetical protein
MVIPIIIRRDNSLLFSGYQHPPLVFAFEASRFLFQALLEVSNWKHLAVLWNDNYLKYSVDPISKYLNTITK